MGKGSAPDDFPGGDSFANLFNSDTEDDEVSAEDSERILYRALGDLPIICDHCNGFCHAHVVRLRDAFLGRSADVMRKLLAGIDLYFMNRSYGLNEPSELLTKIYEDWAELVVLYKQAEPQATFQNMVEEEGDQEEDDE